MKVLVSAYACEPASGSEPGAGWNWARQIATEHDVWVLTRANNREAIELALSSVPQPRLHFIYTDLPRWLRFWKRGQRGVRLYYYLWQFAALRAARRSHRDVGFDVVHHVTFANAFVPALVALLPIPFVLGPVGGGVPVPWRCAGGLGAAGIRHEILRVLRRAVGRRLDPLVRMTWRRASLILVQNTETLARLPARHQARARVFPNAGIDEAEIKPRVPRMDGEVLAVTAGRLVPLKAVSLTLKAVAEANMPNLRLLVAGDGPARRQLEGLASRLGIESQVDFLGWLNRAELFDVFARADVFLFTSLHDECGFALAEAMAHGLVPVALSSGGPSVLVGDAGFLLPVAGLATSDIIRSLATVLRTLAAEVPPDLRRKAAERAQAFEWGRKIDAFQHFVPAVSRRTVMARLS